MNPASVDPLLQRYLDEVRPLALNDADQRPLWAAYKRCPTMHLRRRLYEANLHKVALIVISGWPGPAPHLDMIQDAALELPRALEAFDPSRGVPFGAYVKKLVTVHAARTFRRLSTVVRFAHTHGDVEVPSSVGLEANEDPAVDDETPEVLSLRQEELRQDKELLRKALRSMDKRQRYIFRQHVLIARPRRLDDIREDLGMSRSRVQTLWKEAVGKVQERQARRAAE